MTVNFSTEKIKTENIKGEEYEREVIVEKINILNNDLVIDKILDFEARIKEISCEIQEGGAEVGGVIQVDLLYTGFDYEEESFIDNFSYQLDFNNYLTIPEAQKNLEYDLDYNLSEENFELLNNNEIKVEFIIDQFVKIFNYQQLEIVDNVIDISSELLDRKTVNFENIIAKGEKNLELENKIELEDEVDKILAVKINLDNQNKEIVNNIVKTKGEFRCEIIYSNQQGVNYKEEVVSFSKDISTLVNQNNLSIESDVLIEKINYNLNQQNQLDLTIDSSIKYKISELKELSFVVDIKSDKFELEKKEIKISEIIAKESISKNIKKNLVVPELKADIDEIIYEKINLTKTVGNLEEGGVLIKQGVEGEVIYSNSQNAKEVLTSFSNNFEISSFISIPNAKEEMNSYTNIMINNLSSELLNSRTVEMNFTIEKKAIVKEFKTLNLITDIIKVAPVVYLAKDKRPSFVIYIVKKDDDLKKIAKQYKVRVKDILLENKMIKNDEIKAGDKILLPKKIINSN